MRPIDDGFIWLILKNKPHFCPMEKVVCVTGATGFLGIHMVLAFLEKGWKVKGLMESQQHLIEAKPVLNFYGEEKAKLYAEIDWYIGDIRKQRTLLQPFKGVDYVVHCAGLVHGKKSDLIRTNQQGTANVVKACIVNKVPKLCYVSTIEGLGRYWNVEHFNETTPYKKSSLTSNYGHSKQLAEKEALNAALHSVDVVVMIPPVIVGPSNWKEGFGRVYKRIYDGVSKSPQGSNAFVDVRDLAQIAVLFHDRKMSGRYLVNASNNAYQEAYQIIGKQFGIQSDFPITKAKKIRLLTWLTWPFHELLGIQLTPNFFMERVRNIQKTSYSAKKFNDETEYSFIPIEESLAFAAQAFLKERNGIA
jgi:nucleoside-diphosphate-sugar epimerase